MIDRNLPEPEPHLRYCGYCFRKSRLLGRLIHWPDENSEEKNYTLLNGDTMIPFSFWFYSCQWCRAAETKRQKRRQKYDTEGFSVEFKRLNDLVEIEEYL